MSRTSRNSITSNFLHIIVQGIEKSHIFNKEQYKRKYINLIQENSEKFDISIISFCVINNHVHLCLYYNNIKDVSSFMHRINTLYANYYNFLENRVGYVFRNRYYSKEIKDRNQLFNTMVYIHKNPIKANLVKLIKEWNFSTYNDYINHKIEDKIIMIVFQKQEYIDIFNKIHSREHFSEVFDVEERKSAKEIIKDYLLDINMSLELVCKEKNLLLELIKKMKYEGRILNKVISKELKINKNTVTRMLRKIQ